MQWILASFIIKIICEKFEVPRQLLNIKSEAIEREKNHIEYNEENKLRKLRCVIAHSKLKKGKFFDTYS